MKENKKENQRAKIKASCVYCGNKESVEKDERTEKPSLNAICSRCKKPGYFFTS